MVKQEKWGSTAPYSAPVTCHTVSLQCSARNWNTIQVNTIQSSKELCGTPGSRTVEIHSRVLGSCPESFPQVLQKVHQPYISISHLVFAGSIPTVRDPGPGEQYLSGLGENHKTDDWVGRGTGVQNRYQTSMIPLNVSYFLSRRKKIIITANG